MNYYENTLIARQDLLETELNKVKDKYSKCINDNSGKVVKIEEWGLLNFAKKIKKYKKGFYIHYKFEGDNKTLTELNKKIKVDNLIIRNLIVKCKKLNTEIEYFKKDK